MSPIGPRRAVVLLALTGALAVLAPAAGARNATHRCPAVGRNVGNVRANVRCAIASKVVRASLRGKRYGGYRCRSAPYPGGANVTCTRGGRRVSYQIAD